MKTKFYGYDKCSTCRNALKFLAGRGIAAEVIPIRETPPTAAELQTMLDCYDGDLRRLFNTSGQDYRAMKLGEKIGSMSKQNALMLLRENGNLVKRPFIIRGTRGMVGFDEAAWSDFFATR